MALGRSGASGFWGGQVDASEDLIAVPGEGIFSFGVVVVFALNLGVFVAVIALGWPFVLACGGRGAAWVTDF
jgi:hypothetical protein